ncbi:hypothetical protein PV327_011651, partial [Microctonus hyperodae]
CIILGLFLLISVGTWLDLTMNDVKGESNFVMDILQCFSAQRNFKNFRTITYNHKGLDSIHLFRFILMSLTIIVHRQLQFLANPMVNSEYFEAVSKKVPAL